MDGTAGIIITMVGITAGIIITMVGTDVITYGIITMGGITAGIITMGGIIIMEILT
jgi:hypothetical protein